MAYQDLLKDTSQYVETGDYFLLTITDLDINQSYPIQFRWKKKDGTFGVWSASKTITTPGESFPNVPSTLTVTGGAGIITVTWDGKDSLGNNLVNFDRLDLYIDGLPFDGTKATSTFFTAGTKTISAPAGTYIIAAYAVSKAGTRSSINTPVTTTVTAVGEAIEAPVAPSSNSFTSARVLSGLTVSWNGSYPSSWTGFQAINIYAGTSASLTSGTYTKVGQMTANKISNTVTIPVDGTYVRYDLPVYIHASSVNKDGTESTLVANVTSQSSGARSAIGSDLADAIISNGKLVDDAVTAAKIATNAITETKIATDAVTSAKIVANAVTADKVNASAITADKIATNAVTAGKIQAGVIDVTKLAAGTISVNNLEAGNISSTSYIRAGSGNTGARVEMSSATISGGPAAGFYIYNSAGTAVLSAPLSGGLSIVGNGTFTGDLSIGSSNSIFKAEPSTGIWLGNSSFSSAPFSVAANGVLKAESGTVGGWTLGNDYLSTTNFKISKADAAIYVGNTSGQHIRLSSTELAHYNGGTPTGKFTLTASNGNLSLSGAITSTSGSIGGWTINSDSISSGGTFINSNGTIQIGVTGDSALYMKAGSDIRMDAGIGASSYMKFYTANASNWSSAIAQVQGGDFRIYSNYLSSVFSMISAATTIADYVALSALNNATSNEVVKISRNYDTSSGLNSDLGTSSQFVQFYKRRSDGSNTVGLGRILSTNATTGPVFATGSDERLKKNIEIFNDVSFIDDIKSINVYKFHDNLANDSDPKTIGFLAKEFYPKYTDVVSGAPEAVDEDGEPDYMTIYRENLIPHLFNAVKYLSAKVEELEGRL